MKELEARLDFLLANAQQACWLFTGWGHAKLGKEFRWWQAERLRLEARNVELERRMRIIQGLDTPWPLKDVLSNLIEATAHLLNDHSCDWLGYEKWMAALDAARDYQPDLERSL